MPKHRRGNYLIVGVSILEIVALISAGALRASGQTSVTTYHYDNNRTGWNKTESVLKPTNVWSPSLGLLHSVGLDDQVDAQPLVVPGVVITAGSNQGKHDVAYVATENNTVYAVDVHSGTVLLSPNFGAPVPQSSLPGQCSNNGPNVGITSTPVIDTGSQLLYVMTYTNDGPTYRLHALNLGNLTDSVTPQVVTATHPLNNGTTFNFNAKYQRQRPALLLANGNVYAGFGSFCDMAANHSRGWLLGWTAGSLEPFPANQNQLLDYQATDQNSFFLSSIWMSGYGPSTDDSGNVLFVTGNSASGTYDGITNIQESVVKVSPTLTTVLSVFTPNNQGTLDSGDTDFGSGGVLVLPDQPGSIPHLAVAAGKYGTMYLMNEDNLGGYSPTTNNVLGSYPVGGCWCGASYFKWSNGNGTVVTSGGSAVEMWSVQTTPSVALTQVNGPSSSLGGVQDPGFFTSISSSGTANPVIWALSRPVNTNPATIDLVAFDPYQGQTTMQPLITVPAGTWPNTGGNANLVPVVANGQVFVASYKQLQIFGLTTTGKSNGSITFSGSERTGYFCAPIGSPCWNMQDCGTVSLTVNGHLDSVWYGLDQNGNPVCEQSGPDSTSDNATTVAARLAAAINSDGSAYVSAGAVNGTLHFVSKVTGAAADYSFSASSATAGPPSVFAPGSTSFPVTPTSGKMTGGN
jgi:hypothetical protein